MQNTGAIVSTRRMWKDSPGGGIDRGPTHRALRRHADRAGEALRGFLPRRELTSEMLFPEGGEQAVDAGFVGVPGAFELYRGSVRCHRMANLRVILR
jgi:hypothetical protein